MVLAPGLEQSKGATWLNTASEMKQMVLSEWYNATSVQPLTTPLLMSTMIHIIHWSRSILEVNMQSLLSGCSTVDEVWWGCSLLPMTALRGIIIIRDCEMDICAGLNSFEKQMNFHTLCSEGESWTRQWPPPGEDARRVFFARWMRLRLFLQTSESL